MSQLKCSVEVVSLLITGHPVTFRTKTMNRRASENFEIFWQDWTCLCMFYVHAFELRMFLQIYVQRVVYELVLTFLFGEAHVEKIRSLFSQLGAEKTGVITYAMKLG